MIGPIENLVNEAFDHWLREIRGKGKQEKRRSFVTVTV